MIKEVIARKLHAKHLREVNRYDWENRTETDVRDKIQANWPYCKDQFSESAQAALDAIRDAGFVIVPREPTEAMVEAGNKEPNYIVGEGYIVHADEIYKAMLSAAGDLPKTPS